MRQLMRQSDRGPVEQQPFPKHLTWARRAKGDEWSWKLLIPRPEKPWMAWVSFGVFGLLAVLWFSEGAPWLAAPATALCLISLAQGIWAQPPKDT